MFSRSDRLKELLREEIILALRQVKDPGLAGFLTVTGLELSADAKTVTAFFSILGNDGQRRSATKALKRAAPFVHHILRDRLTIKKIPAVVFVYDDTPQKASRVDKILLRLENEQQQNQGG